MTNSTEERDRITENLRFLKANSVQRYALFGDGTIVTRDGLPLLFSDRTTAEAHAPDGYEVRAVGIQGGDA